MGSPFGPVQAVTGQQATGALDPGDVDAELGKQVGTGVEQMGAQRDPGSTGEVVVTAAGLG